MEKVLSWFKDHLTLVIAAIIFVVMIVTLSTNSANYDYFFDAWENVKKHYAKSEKAIEKAGNDATKRDAEIVKKHEKAVKAADEKKIAGEEKVEHHREKIEEETKKALASDRKKVAQDLASTLGVKGPE